MEEAEPQLDAESMIAALRAGGSVFAEEEFAVLLAHAQLEGRGDPEAVEDSLVMFLDRRVHGERIEHIIRRAHFGEVSVAVEFGVFVPRNRTVLLATVVADELRERRAMRGTDAPRPRLLDFGCGSGAIAVLVRHRVPEIDVVAVDADESAVTCARGNLPGARVLQAESVFGLVDADAARHDAVSHDAAIAISASAPFDVIAANLPYVPTGQLPLLPRGTLESEPRLALDGGDTGLEPLETHAIGLAGMLRSGGLLVTEVAPHQVEAGLEVLDIAGFAHVEVQTDDDLDATVLVGVR